MKKLLAICLSVLLICAAMPFAFATAAEDPTIVVSDAEGQAGEIVSVTVSMKNNPGIVSTRIKVGYDSSALEILEPSAGDFAAAGYTWGDWEGGQNPFVINWCYAIGKDDTSELLATLTFKIKDDAAAGVYPFTLEYSCEDDIYNANWDTVEFVDDCGAVTVIGDEPVDPPVECEHEYDAACDPECNLCGEIRPVHTEGIIHFDAVEPGCHYNGNIEYWFCPACEIFWQDAELTQITNSKNIIVPALGGDVIAFEAIEPGCHYDGQIAYWFCADCEQFWQDEALTQLTNSKNVVLPATGSENLQHVEAVEPTCSSEGNIEYWFCPDCEQYWQDEALTQLTNSKNVLIGTADHNLVHFDAVEPGCHYNGNIEYWFCVDCEIVWQNAELTQITNLKNVIVPAIGGDVIAFEAIEPGCHYDGQIAYWFCPECECFWQDEALTQLTNSKNVVLPAIGSENVEHVEAVEATCYSGGNIEYWHCADCDKYWQDEALTQLTNRLNVMLPSVEHNIVHIDAVDPGCHYLGNIEYWYCTVCEIFWQDEALTQITNSKNVILPALGGDVVAFEAIEPGCHYDGQIAYWFCAQCEQVWQDEALTQLTNLKNVVLPAIGSENLQHVEAKEPTCSSEGNIEYWFCPDCEQYWQDEALTQLTNSKNVLIGTTEHNIVHIDAVEPGCHYLGNIEYWYCTVCEMFWQDEALTQITNSKNVILPALGGDVIAFEAIEPGCHYDGQIAYWFCAQCEQVWQDEALTQLTNLKNVVLPATGSENLQHVEAKEPTCLDAGNIEYWFCPDCEQYWQDEALTQLTNSKNVLIVPVDHTIVHFEAVEPGCHYNGNIEYWFCSVCEMFWQNAELTQITNSKNVILPYVGSENLQHVEAKAPDCHVNGNIEYWFCPDCEQYWQDEALTQLTNVKNVIVPGNAVQHFDAQAPTADQAGNVEHWFCAGCDSYWSDAALETEITEEEVIIPATGTVEPDQPDQPGDPDSPDTGDSNIAVVVALLTLIASGVAVVVLKNKKRA